MQAIILAAGMGRRLGTLTKENTKCMVPVNGIKLIDRLLSQLDTLLLDRIILVVGYKRDSLKKHITDNYKGSTRIEFIDNPIYNKTNNIYSLSLAKNELIKDDTILIESDLIFSDRIFIMISECQYQNVALVAKYEPWMDGTMVCIDKDNNITEFISKKSFRYADTYKYYKTINIYKFSKEFLYNIYVPFLEAYSKALGNNEYYEQVLKVITHLDDNSLKALPIGDVQWYEIDDMQDLDISETIFADKEDLLPKYFERYGGYWRFPRLLDFCYLVNPFFPPRRMLEELKSNFDVLLTEYPSGMKVNNMLAAKNFKIKQDYIIVGNGAAELIKTVMEDIDGQIGVIYPTFEEYSHRAVHEDNIVAFIPKDSKLRYTTDELIAFYADKDLSLLLLINPDNPTGNYIPKKDVIRLTKWCMTRNIVLLLDESFVDFTDGSEGNSLICDNILETYTNLIIIKSISKSYGVPGLRLGILACGNTTKINRLKKQIAIWNINSFAEYYMQIYSKYEKDYKEACRMFAEERACFFRKLSLIPYLEVLPSQANYFCCKVKSRFTSKELTEKLLLEYNILIKDCNNKKGLTGHNYVRIAIRRREDNETLIQSLKQI